MFAKGYGVRDIDAGGAVDEHTRFAIGSTTKAMTAAALGMLVDEGKLSWDDPVTKYLPVVPAPGPVGHPARSPSATSSPTGPGSATPTSSGTSATPTTREILEKLALVEPAYSMRSSFIYQNLMYATAGEVVAAVSGMPWADFVRTRIFRPLGMDETRARHWTRRVGQPNVARPTTAWTARPCGSRTPRWTRSRRRARSGPASPTCRAGSASSWPGASPRTARGCSRKPRWTSSSSPQTMVTPSQFYPTAQLTHPHWTTYGLRLVPGGLPGREGGLPHRQHRRHGGHRRAHPRPRTWASTCWPTVTTSSCATRSCTRSSTATSAARRRDWSADLKAMYDSLAAQGEARQASGGGRARRRGRRPRCRSAPYAGRYADPLYGELVRHLDRRTASGRTWAPASPATLEHWSYDTFRLRFDARWRGWTLVRSSWAPTARWRRCASAARS